MDPRESRFRLRIETGTHQGETVDIPDAGLSIGRRSSNQLSLTDASVSGAHAEIRPEGADLLLVDLGSTNGTKVAGEKIETHRLAHGDHFSIGSVQAIFLDATLERTETGPSAPDGGLDRISADRVSASGRRGFLGLVLLVVVVVGGAAAWWFLRGSDAGDTVVEIPEVPGNLVAGGTFEKDEVGAGWSSAPTAPQSFFRDSGFASTGRRGYGVLLEEGEWAMEYSELIAIGLREGYEVRASLLAEDGARARLGVRYSSSNDSGPDFHVWSRIVAPEDEFTDVELLIAGLPGYDRASVVLAATADQAGAVSVDDVIVLASERGKGTAVTFHDFEARIFGSESTSTLFERSGRVLFCGIDFAAWNDSVRGAGGGAWSAAPLDKGLEYRCAGVPADGVLELTVNADAGSGSDTILLAAIGPDGYRALASEFDVKQAESLLLGRGVDLVRLGFDAPIRITGKMSGSTLRLRAHAGAVGGFHLQLTFVEERIRAKDLADQAREAEMRGGIGGALAAWNTLLDEVPYDVDLVARAEAERGRLVQDGMERVDTIRAEVERARFFALTELYRQCRGSADAVAVAYGTSEVATEASGLVEEIDGEIAALLERTPNTEHEKLRVVLAAIATKEAPDLAAHVREVLGTQEQVDPTGQDE